MHVSSARVVLGLTLPNTIARANANKNNDINSSNNKSNDATHVLGAQSRLNSIMPSPPPAELSLQTSRHFFHVRWPALPVPTLMSSQKNTTT